MRKSGRGSVAYSAWAVFSEDFLAPDACYKCNLGKCAGVSVEPESAQLVKKFNENGIPCSHREVYAFLLKTRLFYLRSV
jgi:hypothetical protein